MTAGSGRRHAPDHAADLSDLEHRVRALEDRDALRALMIRGWRALDRRDWRTWSACWAEDAVLEFGPWEQIRGREAIRAKVEAAESPYASMQHHILNMHVDVAGDRATGIGYMWFVAVTTLGRASAPYSVGGPYDWEFRRYGDNWLLVRQRLGVWWTDGEDTLGAFGPQRPGSDHRSRAGRRQHGMTARHGRACRRRISVAPCTAGESPQWTPLGGTR
ncbi:nuclear transport factor 2 family protein [Streptomyces jumonjinensis]|nr:nuclear transport factor 2 family protein [Streptomyces jumonjinensis]